jgi:hypothetical protein
MKKFLFALILILLLGAAMVEATKHNKQKSGIYSKPTTTDDEGKPTTASNKATDKGKKTDTYYVVNGENYKYNGEDTPPGTILINPDKTKITTVDSSGQPISPASPEIQSVPSTTATTIGKKDYDYDDESRTFEYTKTTTKKDDNLFENYKVTTTTTTTIGEDGTVTTTQDQVTKVCGKGLTTCQGTYEQVAHQSRATVFKPETKKDEDTGKTETRLVLTETRDTIYGKDGKEKGQFIITYMPTDKENVFSKPTTRDVIIEGTDGKKYYEATTDPDTGETTVVTNNLDNMPGLTRAERDALRQQAVQSGALGFDDALQTLTWYQSTGRFIRAYYEYAGLRQLTSLLWPSYDQEVQERKAKIQQEFCLAAGITNCAVSKICGKIYPIEADNVLAGRGPGGKYVTSAVLNAERSIPIEVEGMTRQQLIDLFGNFTVIKGVLINLTDPSFDPRVLGKLKMRLYHIQYAVTNNAEDQEDLGYNIVFRKVDEQLNSSYGTPIDQARWWTDKQPTVSYLATARDDLYKFSATEYNSVCLTFSEDLPSGDAARSDLVDELCVPIVEYAGPPTEVGAGPGQEAPPTPGTAVTSQPGAQV